MIKKIRRWWEITKKKRNFKKYGDSEPPRMLTQEEMEAGSYTFEQLQNAYLLGYNDGKRDGLAIARQQATKSLKEILQWQNQNNSQK